MYKQIFLQHAWNASRTEICLHKEGVQTGIFKSSYLRAGAFVTMQSNFISLFTIQHCCHLAGIFLKTNLLCVSVFVFYSTQHQHESSPPSLSAPTANLAPGPAWPPASSSAPAAAAAAAAAAGPAPGCDWFWLPEKTKWHDTLLWICIHSMRNQQLCSGLKL